MVIGTAAYLHDIHRLMQNETGQFVVPKDSLGKVREILDRVNFPKDKVNHVLHCIEFHEEYGFNGKTVTNLETLILQDAGALDAMGAIGIARTFEFDGAHGAPAWIPEIPINENSYDPSTIHHFYSKLLRLGENMSTKTAKEMAKKRHDYMKDFVDTFMKEWAGEI